MRFFTSSTFRACLAELMKKPREGYSSVVKDLCEELKQMEYARLVLEVTNESQVQALHQVDINNSLAEQSTKASLTKEFTPQ